MSRRHRTPRRSRERHRRDRRGARQGGLRQGPSDPVIGSFQPAAAGSGSNSQLSELAGRIKSLITEGNDAKTAAKKACAEAKDAKDMAQSSRAAAEQKYKEAGELLREAQKRALDFQGFLKDFGISRSRAYRV